MNKILLSNDKNAYLYVILDVSISDDIYSAFMGISLDRIIMLIL